MLRAVGDRNFDYREEFEHDLAMPDTRPDRWTGNDRPIRRDFFELFQKKKVAIINITLANRFKSVCQMI